MMEFEQLQAVVEPWLHSDAAVLERASLPDGVTFAELRSPGSSNVLRLSFRLHEDSVVSLADSVREYGSLEIEDSEASQLLGLVETALHGTAQILMTTALLGSKFRFVRWPGHEWSFALPIGTALLSHRLLVIDFEPYNPVSTA